MIIAQQPRPTMIYTQACPVEWEMAMYIDHLNHL